MLLRPVIAFAAMAALLASPAAAEKIALVIGNAEYDTADDLRHGTAPVGAADALQDAGIATVRLRNGSAAETRQALAQVEQMAPAADGILIVLSGRFVHSGDDTWFLPTDASGESLAGLADRGIPLSIFSAMLDLTPGSAVMVLGNARDEPRQAGPLLANGLVPPDLPPGATAILGTPREVARLISETLAEPGASIGARVRDDDLIWKGYRPDGFSFLTDEPGVSQAELDRARDRAADDEAWRIYVGLDTIEAYEAYLRDHPQGRHADTARQRIAEFRDEPNRQARLREEALDLPRERRQRIQRDLTTLGYDTRGVEGIFGPGTRSAVSRWQTANDLPETGYLDRAQIDRIDRQARRRAEERERAERRERKERERKDRAYWKDTGQGGDEDALRAYLDRYPEGLFAEEARRELAAYEDGREQRRRAEERRIWEQLRDRDTAEAYRRYLDTYPEGRFVQEARRRLDRLTDGPEPDDAARQAEAALGLNVITRRAVESRLASLGHGPGDVDGQFDGQARAAIRSYQDVSGLPVTGYLSEEMVVRLLADTVRGLFD